MVTPGKIGVKTFMLTIRRAWLLWGLAAAVCYMASVWTVVRPVPVRILYEGMAPLPRYRWVTPPADLAAGNEPPKGWSASIPFLPRGLQPGSFATGDGQVIAVIRQGAILRHPGEASVRVTLTPLDAAALAPPPAGMRFDGNAYRVEAVYDASGDPATIRIPATIVLRYARHAEELLRLDGSTWTGLIATTVPESMQIFATTDRLGVFVTAGPPWGGRAGPWWAYAASIVVLLLASVAFLRGRRRAGRP